MSLINPSGKEEGHLHLVLDAELEALLTGVNGEFYGAPQTHTTSYDAKRHVSGSFFAELGYELPDLGDLSLALDTVQTDAGSLWSARLTLAGQSRVQDINRSLREFSDHLPALMTDRYQETRETARELYFEYRERDRVSPSRWKPNTYGWVSGIRTFDHPASGFVWDLGAGFQKEERVYLKPNRYDEEVSRDGLALQLAASAGYAHAGLMGAVGLSFYADKRSDRFLTWAPSPLVLLGARFGNSRMGLYDFEAKGMLSITEGLFGSYKTTYLVTASLLEEQTGLSLSFFGGQDDPYFTLSERWGGRAGGAFDITPYDETFKAILGDSRLVLDVGLSVLSEASGVEGRQDHLIQFVPQLSLALRPASEEWEEIPEEELFLNFGATQSLTVDQIPATIDSAERPKANFEELAGKVRDLLLSGQVDWVKGVGFKIRKIHLDYAYIEFEMVGEEAGLGAKIGVWVHRDDRPDHVASFIGLKQSGEENLYRALVLKDEYEERLQTLSGSDHIKLGLPKLSPNNIGLYPVIHKRTGEVLVWLSDTLFYDNDRFITAASQLRIYLDRVRDDDPIVPADYYLEPVTLALNLNMTNAIITSVQPFDLNIVDDSDNVIRVEHYNAQVRSALTYQGCEVTSNIRDVVECVLDKNAEPAPEAHDSFIPRALPNTVQAEAKILVPFFQWDQVGIQFFWGGSLALWMTNTTNQGRQVRDYIFGGHLDGLAGLTRPIEIANDDSWAVTLPFYAAFKAGFDAFGGGLVSNENNRLFIPPYPEEFSPFYHNEVYGAGFNWALEAKPLEVLFNAFGKKVGVAPLLSWGGRFFPDAGGTSGNMSVDFAGWQAPVLTGHARTFMAGLEVRFPLVERDVVPSVEYERPLLPPKECPECPSCEVEAQKTEQLKVELQTCKDELCRSQSTSIQQEIIRINNLSNVEFGDNEPSVEQLEVMAQKIRSGSEWAPDGLESALWLMSDIMDDAKKSVIKLPVIVSRMKEMIGKNPGIHFKLVAHTDTRGDGDYNQSLSMRRAIALREYLVSAGIPGNFIEIEGRGESEELVRETSIPTDLRRNAEEINRRIEITVIWPEIKISEPSLRDEDLIPGLDTSPAEAPELEQNAPEQTDRFPVKP